MRSTFNKRNGIGRIGTRALKRDSTGRTITERSLQLTITLEGNLFYGNQRVGYLDETETLYGINRKGYAVRIGPSERRTACDDLKAWWNEASSR